MRDPFISKKFGVVKAIDQMPLDRDNGLYIYNQDFSDQTVSHWILIYFTSDNINVYFDSYGDIPLPMIKQYFFADNKSFVYNTVRVQGNSNTWGQHSLFTAYYLVRNYYFHNILDMYTTGREKWCCYFTIDRNYSNKTLYIIPEASVKKDCDALRRLK